MSEADEAKRSMIRVLHSAMQLCSRSMRGNGIGSELYPKNLDDRVESHGEWWDGEWWDGEWWDGECARSTDFHCRPADAVTMSRTALLGNFHAIRTYDMKRVNILQKIADSNRPVAPGPGLEMNHFMPLCEINNRALAATFQRLLADNEIGVKTESGRLSTRFFVAREHFPRAQSIRKTLLDEHPDTTQRSFSRDYDGLFLLTPFVVLSAVISYAFLPKPNWLWIGILVTGVSAMILWERVSRQYRLRSGAQIGIVDLLWAVTLVAVNVAVWRMLI